MVMKIYLKFSAVLGVMSAKSSILILPAGMDPMVTSKKTMGFLGFGGRRCQSMAAAALFAPAISDEPRGAEFHSCRRYLV